MKATSYRAALGLLVLTLSAQSASAQGFIVDHRPRVPIAGSYEIREVTLDARVRDQVADVRVSQTFHNPGSVVLNAEYLFPIPDDGAIQNFVLMVDGKELPGRLLPKDEARRIYEEIVRIKRDPALLEYMGRGLFRTSVFPIPPGADRKVTLRYTQLCRRDRDVVEFSYPLGTQKFTAKPIQHLALTAHISSTRAIKSVYSPTHDATIERTGDREATLKLERRDVVPSEDFRAVYTLAEGALGATVLSYRPSDSEDGFFLVLASPEVKAPDAKPAPKTVVFVLDRSGSMSGKKIEQAKKAIQFVLNNLREGDTFNIVVYDDQVETYKPELERYSAETRAQASRWVENIQAGGSTNIDGALKAALGVLSDASRPNYVLFMTDGLPTVGEQRETAIAANAHAANQVHARIFAFGVGFDVNARLLDRLSGGNAGTSEYVKPDEDIESHMARFYGKLTSPALTGLQIELTGSDVNRTYPRDIPDLFEGGQLVWVGRYRQPGNATLRLSGKVAGEPKTFDFPAELAASGAGANYDFVEKLWVVRRIGFIIDQIDLNGENKELTDELVALSTKHGVLTPYTSFLADERVPLHARRDNVRRATESLRELQTLEGEVGVRQRMAKQLFLNAEQAGAIGSPADAFAVPAGAAPRSSAGTAGRGGLGVGLGMPVTRLAGVAAEARADKPAAATVRQVGSKTFYRKADRWVDAAVTPDAEAKALRVEQFSDAFFELARSQGAELNQYLAFGEPVTVELGGKVYRIERASHD